MTRSIASANATFCAAVFDQLIADGLEAVFIAPGSRSTPLALAAAARHDLRVAVYHDERSASFAALGHGLSTGLPAVVICTSGTAAAHFHAAVIEAHLSAVPLLVMTADRPPELWGRGAPQTIDQTDIYGEVIRAFLEPGPPDDLDPGQYRDVARRAWASATGPTPGPVHLNLSFREPLVGDAEPLPTALPAPASIEPLSAAPDVVAEIAERVRRKRGVVIAGRCETEPDAILDLAAALGWPVIADHRSGCRRPQCDTVIDHYDALLRHAPFAEAKRPEVVLRIGEIVSSKAVSLWLRDLDADVLASRPHGRHIDPEAIADLQFDEWGVVAALVAALGDDDACDPSWLAGWRAADDRAAEALTTVLATVDAPTEIGIARAALAAVPSGGCLVAASSMPVRDIEWYGGRRDDVTVVSNRGANGIDGTVATAAGIAATGVPTVVLIGDVALLHDATSLTALAARGLDLTIVVVDNDGGGIFSFLPQRSLLTHERYEQLFGTPHGTDLAGLASAHGIAVESWTPATALAPSGTRMVIASTVRDENLATHDAVNAAIAAAIG